MSGDTTERQAGHVGIAGLDENLRLNQARASLGIVTDGDAQRRATYAGLWVWPPPEPLPVDLLDPEQAAEMKRRLEPATVQIRLQLKIREEE